MKVAEKIQELERRIRELEARPVYVPIYVGSPQPLPYHQPLYPTTQPWQPPWISWGGYSNTAGCAPVPMTQIYEFNA